MICQVTFVVFAFISANTLTTLAMPQRAQPDPFSESAKWFEQMAGSVNKDFKPTFQDQPNTPFQTQQDPAAQASSMGTQQKADGVNSEISFFTPDEISFFVVKPGFTFGPCAGFPCTNPDQPQAASQGQQNAGFQNQASPGFQAQSSQEFQAKQDTVSQGQQTADFQSQQNTAQPNPGAQGQQTVHQNQAPFGFQNPFQPEMNFINNFFRGF